MKRSRFSDRLVEKQKAKRKYLYEQRVYNNVFIDLVGRNAAIDKLPDEILALIFHKLDFRKRFKLELVCHRWKNVVISHGWFDFKILELFHYTPSTKKINTLLKRCGKYLTELNLHDVRWSDCGLMDRLSEMPNLRHISLGSKCETIHSRITSEQLSRIAHLYPQLLSLNIWRGFHFNGENVAAHGLSEVLSRCSSMEFLSLCRAPDISRKFRPTTLPPNLVFLETDDTFDLQTIFEIASRYCNRIKCLSLQFLKPLTSPFAFITANTLKQLVHLEIDFHGTPCFDFFPSFITALEFLENLRILRCAKMSGEALIAVIGKCPNLEDLGYSAYYMDILPAFRSLHLLNKLRHLVICHLGKAPRFSGREVPNDIELFLGKALEQIARNGHLRLLSLNFELPIQLMCNMITSCKVLTSLFCPIRRLNTRAQTICECIRQINRDNDDQGAPARTLNLSVNYNQSLILRDSYVHFIYQPEAGSEIVKRIYEEMFISVPKFLYSQPDNEDYEIE